MKKDQTRNMGYPMYPTYPGVNPMMPMPYGMPGVNMNQMGMTQGCACSGNNNNSNDFSTLQNEIENLKKRVSYLENNLVSNYNNNYNSSNYQVM